MVSPGVSLRWCWSGSGHYQDQSRTTKKIVVEARTGHRALLHFRGAAGSWEDRELRCVRNLEDGRSVHELVDDRGLLPAELEFVLCGAGPSGEVWDNNQGENYRLGRADGPLLRIPVVLGTLGLHEGVLSGLIYVQNLSFQKRVRAHCSTDQGRSFLMVEAVFKPYLAMGPRELVRLPNRHNCEAWEVSIPCPPEAAARAQLWVELECAGLSHRDDNDGALYSLERRPSLV